MSETHDPIGALAENHPKRALAVQRSVRTITRWRRQPPKVIRDLLSSADGRRLLRSWLQSAESATS